MSIQERRRFMRIGTEFAADYWAKGPSLASGQAQVRDFCRQGLGVWFSGPIQKGEHVELTFRLPGTDAPILATGEVAWTQSPAAEGGRTGGGLKFLSIHPLDLARLLDFVYARWLGASPNP